MTFAGPARGAEKQRLLAGLAKPPRQAARFLLGQFLVRRIGQRRLVLRIVEAEAYLGRGDEAAHAFRGRTPRTAPLWDGPGTLYVYFIYGMHHCLNLSVDQAGVPGCVLLRAAEPVDDALGADGCRGPGRLCRTLGVDTRLSGRSVFEAATGLWLREGAPVVAAVSRRVGIRSATERLLRFYDPTSPAVSRGR